MEGGNGVRGANGITHSPERRRKRRKRAYQNDEAETLPRMDSALGVLLDGFAVKEMRKLPKISFAAKATSPCWIAAVSAAEVFKAQRTQRNGRRASSPAPAPTLFFCSIDFDFLSDYNIVID